MPTIEDHEPKDSWIIARTFLLAKHEAIFDEVISSVNSLKLEASPRLLLGIQGLSQCDILLLKMVHPTLRFYSNEIGEVLVEDDGRFDEVEQTLSSLGSHPAFARLILADMAVMDMATVRTLEAQMAKHPDVFEAGVSLINAAQIVPV